MEGMIKVFYSSPNIIVIVSGDIDRRCCNPSTGSGPNEYKNNTTSHPPSVEKMYSNTHECRFMQSYISSTLIGNDVRVRFTQKSTNRDHPLEIVGRDETEIYVPVYEPYTHTQLSESHFGTDT